MTFNETEEQTLNTETAAETEEDQPVLDDAQIRAAALAYARYLKDNDLSPGEAAFDELQENISQETGDDGKEASQDESASEGPAADENPDKEKEDRQSEKKKAAALLKRQKREEAKAREREKFLRGGKGYFAGVTDLHDKVQDGIDGTISRIGRELITGIHKLSSTYSNSKRGIGIAILVTGLLAAGILVVFDMFTVYEYAYNGKVLGYVNNQEDVTDVLEVAGSQLTSNSSTEADVKFVANQNVTFNPVDGRGKSTDDSDTVVNKLIYMTDIETEAYAVYDGDKVVAIVKDQNDADSLLLQAKSQLSTPDKGMELVSSDFTNDLAVKPVNVLLGSIQSNVEAQEQMVNGGEMYTFHIVEEGETLQGLASLFGVETADIFNEDNSKPVSEIEQGDRVCIRNIVAPVSVSMTEEGKLREVIEFETIKKETDELYKGDTQLQQEGRDGYQIFEGTITKVGGEIVEKVDTKEPETIIEKKDKIILVGTAERPKTAATGTFIMPIKTYVVTSEWGGRWGRMHEGMDFGAGTGTPIYAADGGKVVKADWFSGHGLCVQIDHGNGVQTRYSHCSQVLVSVGDLVYQGQNIALVGNTGHSFGSHLHFEVRVNDVSQNPRNYINP